MARKYGATLLGGAAITALIGAGALHFGGITIDELAETSARGRAETFAAFLMSDETRLQALLTGLPRNPDTESDIRWVAQLSHIARFTVFDADGLETFATHSIRQGWLLRERPGGTASGTRLSPALMERPGSDWQVVHARGPDRPSVVMPLARGGTPVAYLSVEFDMAEERAGHAAALARLSMQLVCVLFLAAGLPALVYIRRKRKMEEADERIIFLHNHDALTSVFNRRRMQEETDRILATSRATRERMALWFVDVQGLGEVNGTLGQSAGDEVLRVTAGRLAEVIDRNDLIARLGADDFAILQRGITSEECMAALARRIGAATAEPIAVGAHSVTPRLTLGVALTPDHGRTYAELVKHAEIAFASQKNAGRGEYTLFRSSMDEEAHRRRIIEQMLREALERGGFELFYQPIVAGNCETLLGFEALIRMPDGEGGYIAPSTFIPIAEARGYIKAIGTWVIGEATRQAALWPDHLFVSVNLSPVQFRDGDLLDIVKTALEDAGVEGGRLEIEVVESLLMDQSEDILTQLEGLKRLGVSIAMDDFGTGYSSLGYLWRFPFDKLKIDRSFMLAQRQGQSGVPQIIATIISLGHHLRLKVTAEGIETAEQAALLRSFGCDQLQGFYFGTPQPASRITRALLCGSAMKKDLRAGAGIAPMAIGQHAGKAQATCP